MAHSAILWQHAARPAQPSLLARGVAHAARWRCTRVVYTVAGMALGGYTTGSNTGYIPRVARNEYVRLPGKPGRLLETIWP